MKWFTWTLACIVLTWLPTAVAEELPQAFNGRNLDGWQVPEANVWWTANEGVLEVRSDPHQQGSVLWTAEEFGNFIMQFDFKIGEGTVDTGVFIRSETEQIQIGESGSLKRDMTGSPYISGKGYPVEATGVAELLKPDDWNSMTILAMGNTYVVFLNGKQVLTYESETFAKKGPIGIQLHPDRDMAASFRNIHVAALD